MNQAGDNRPSPARFLAILDELHHAAIIVSHDRDLLDATTTRRLRLSGGVIEAWE